MSRPSSTMAQRNLTLTEELEKLEQSITLTLQEIDHNFSRAHRIVTSRILPVVEQYAKHSEAVWDGSKFWKQFFEASANVSLSGYEEPAGGEDTTLHQDDTTHASTAYDDSPSGRHDTTIRSGDEGLDVDDSILSSPSLTRTPRNPRTSATFANDYPSPYEALKRELHGGDNDNDAGGGAGDELSSDGGARDEGTFMGAPTTPGKPSAAALPDMSMTPESSPFAPDSAEQHAQQQRPSNTDPLLHRMLDKTYRIAATPHTARKLRGARDAAAAGTPGTANRTRRRLDFDSSPMSSPEGAAPQLRAEIFSSPMKTPRTPGVSVLRQPQHRTPGPDKSATAGRTLDFGAGTEGGRYTGAGSRADIITWDSDSEDDDTQFSPPKTMQFHVPQSRLLQTPAREASRRIVEDLLLTAGGGEFTDSNVTDDSPSVVRRNHELDDSF